MICHRYKCIFIHQRKCAGSSIIRSFNYTNEDSQWHLLNDGTLSPEWDEIKKKYPEYLVFTVVRNPWERFVSGWKYLKAFKDHSLSYVLQNLPQEGHDYRHLTRPQLDTLIDKEGNFVPDIVLRFETLQEDYSKFCKQIGKKNNLEHVNKTEHKGMMEFSGQEDIGLVAKHFKKDIDYFRFTYGNSSCCPAQ